MSNKQGGVMFNKLGRFLYLLSFGLLLLIAQIASVHAADLTLSNVGVVALDDGKLQVQLDIAGGTVGLPKVFQTENPARIALDFSGVKNTLPKKMYPVNQGAISNIYVVTEGDRLRVVINLLESSPFETKVVNNQVLLTLNRNAPTAAGVLPAPVARASTLTDTPPPAVLPATPNGRKSAISALMPEQAISGFDFKRGDKGEGRILISLANPNTIVNTRSQGGKVVLNFANTRLPSNLSKRLDVSEFGTPVKFIDAVSSGRDSTLSITTQNTLYDFSSFQANGLLTVEFRPLTEGEKQAKERARAEFTGDRLSLHFQEIEVRSVIAILAEFTGQNIVAGDDVTGTITLKLDDVPWDEALAFILMTKDLGKYETGNVTLISPLDRIRTYKEKQQATEKVVAAQDPLLTEYIKINYASAGALLPLLRGNSAGVNTCVATTTAAAVTAVATTNPVPVTSPAGGAAAGSTAENGDTTVGLSAVSTRGSIVVDQRTNTIIVRDTAKRLDEVRSLIRKLDVPIKQVMIESRIVTATNNFVKELGVKFGTGKFGLTGNNTAFGVGGTGTKGSITGTGTTTQVGSVLGSGGLQPSSVNVQDQLVSLATTGTPMGALGMTLARGADYVLNLELQALQSQGKGELISNPRVMTSDRCQATIKQGVQIPFTSATAVTAGSAAAVSTTIFVDAVLELDATPQIAPNGSIIMKLNITNNSVGIPTALGQPTIEKREIHTNVRVLDGETVVLGGIFQETIANNLDTVPFFSDLPGIGFLFKHTYKQDNKTELLIFVTPKVVKDSESVE